MDSENLFNSEDPREERRETYSLNLNENFMTTFFVILKMTKSNTEKKISLI